MSEGRLPFHPYAELFPRMTNAEFEGLCGDIARKGLLEEIIRYEGKILEGRERYVACERKKVPPRFREYAGECGSPLEFVVSKNLHRRHLTEGQRALVAARLRPHFQEEARQRQLATLKKGSQSPVTPSLEEREKQPKNAEAAEAGTQPSVPPSLEEREKQPKNGKAAEASQPPVTPSLEEREKQPKNAEATETGSPPPVTPSLEERGKRPKSGETAEQAAVLMKVSRSSVYAAETVKKRGISQLVNALAAGKVSVSAAARIARLPAEQQQAVVAGIESGLKATQALAQVQETLANGQAGSVDDDGRPLPEKVIPAFRQRKQLESLCRRLKAISAEVEQLRDSPVGIHLDVQGVLTCLEAARKALSGAQPARLCPHESANASGCEACRGSGWLPSGMGFQGKGAEPAIGH